MDIRSEAIEFLREYPPFKFLDEAVLDRIASRLSMEYYPKGTKILAQGGPPGAVLSIIKEGGVKVLLRPDEGGEEQVVDYRAEGDTFGFLSLIGKEHQNTTVVAHEDTTCYQLPRDEVMRLLEGNPSFTEYFLKSHFTKYIHKTYSEMHGRSLMYGSADKLLFTTPVGELSTRGVVTGLEDIPIGEAAETMSRNRISSLVIVDGEGVPVGIVTDRDLRDKVLARGRSPRDAVREIMSVPIIKVSARDYCFEALLAMMRYGVHHLLVVDAGKLHGVVTNHDFMMLQGTSPFALVKEIENQWQVEGLARVSRKITGMVGLLLKEGARAGNITRILTEINDRLTRKIILIAEKELGPPPVEYCWIGYGSEGRKEQTFKTDQDNAIVYADPASPEDAREAERYFELLAAGVNDAMVRCGFARCRGGYMASNPRWRQPLSAWKRYFTDWISAPTPEAILFSVILFDFRPIHGSLSLAGALRRHLGETLRGHDMFLKFMADMVVSVRPPLGFFKNFVVEKTGEHKRQMNLKHKCLAPLINMVRLYALERGVPETSTIERIDALRTSHRAVEEHGEEIEHAFEFIMLLRTHRQYDRIARGGEPDNFVNPDGLSSLEKKTLKEVCLLISRLQDTVFRHYNPGL